MSERGLPSADASPACPFVAFDDDRDERADRPDHRHRCYAEPEPAPRALAHQEAYCLSSAFPVCPVFQEWARRESARARAAEEKPAPTPAAASTVSAAAGADEWVSTSEPNEELPIESRPRRNPPRDWAAPPPWAGGQGGSRFGGADRDASGRDVPTTGPVEGQGLAGSAADRLASGGSLSDGSSAAGGPRDVPSTGPDPDLAVLVAGSAAAHRASADERIAAERATERAAEEAAYAHSTADYPAPTRTGRRPAVSSTRAADRERERPPQREHVQSHDGPAWERARRAEAYPQIKARASMSGLPGLPRVALLAGALGIAALALFFLPALIGVGGGDNGASPTPSPSAAVATPTPEPTPEPAPTPQTYVIKEGDTLSKVAKEFGLTLEQLLEANTKTIKDPNKISVGDEIIIPVPPADEVGGSESPAP
ncbi:MAG: LysM domain-containing protein [Candidatus Limnocylindrales bacterium]